MDKPHTDPASVAVEQRHIAAARSQLHIPAGDDGVITLLAHHLARFERDHMQAPSPAPEAGEGVERMAALLCNDIGARVIAEQVDASPYIRSPDYVQNYWRTLARAALKSTGSVSGEAPADTDREQIADWPARWRQTGYNGAFDQAVRALRFLAENDRPSGGEQFPNSAACHMIADDLARTQRAYAQALQPDRDALVEAAVLAEREACARIADKRMDDRFEEYGTREPDTNATYYSGRRGETLEELDKEDEAIAIAIRSRAALNRAGDAHHPGLTP